MASVAARRRRKLRAKVAKGAVHAALALARPRPHREPAPPAEPDPRRLPPALAMERAGMISRDDRETIDLFAMRWRASAMFAPSVVARLDEGPGGGTPLSDEAHAFMRAWVSRALRIAGPRIAPVLSALANDERPRMDWSTVAELQRVLSTIRGAA